MAFFIGRITKKQDKKEEKQEKTELDMSLLKEAVIELLRVQLIEYHDRYIDYGYIPTYALDNFVKMYNTYRSLGGNGLIVELHNEVIKLPIRKKHDMEGD
jgi:hypothetical protein